jgi:hemerythrin-like domain-containing protein
MTRPWADQPFQLMPVPGAPGAPTVRANASARCHPAPVEANIHQCSDPNILALAAEMANAHNALIRGLNAIYLQCPHVHEEQDIADFALYIKTWGDTVHHHHETEEKFLFPELERIAKAEGATELVMATNEQQHRLFEAKVAAQTEYAQDVLQKKRKYDSNELKDLIDQFAPVLTEHLHEEINTLFQLEKYRDTASMKKAMDRTGQEAAKNADVVGLIAAPSSCFLTRGIAAFRASLRVRLPG